MGVFSWDNFVLRKAGVCPDGISAAAPGGQTDAMFSHELPKGSSILFDRFRCIRDIAVARKQDLLE